MKPLFYSILILSLIIICNCENYIEFKEIDGLITKNDLSLTFKVLDDSEHTYEIRKITEENSENEYYLEIDVENKFSLSTGEVGIHPGKKYKLSLTLKNHGANPVFLYSFWKKPKTSLRNYTFVGENGNPPASRTQELYSEWKTFEEIFETRDNEDCLMIRMYADKGMFSIGNIAIEEVHP